MEEPKVPEKGSAFDPEMGGLEREKPIEPATTPPPAVDLGSFGCEPVKAAPVATSVVSAAVAKVAPMPPHPSEVVFFDGEGRVKPDAQMNRFERGIREQAKVVWDEALKALQTQAEEVKIDPTTASRPIGSPPPTA